MGIDIYASWRNQTEKERRSQTSSWLLATAGGIGYLREAYHGAPYATRHLVSEAFETGEARIPAATLRDRLPHTLILAEHRERKLYGSPWPEIERVRQSYRDFVALCEQKERETGEPVLITASF